jgi:chromosome segregation protein
MASLPRGSLRPYFRFSHVRLTKLKLSGFKSFVEPTTVLFPGQLAGVVGPNGCGKSNIIDAVRWVLGESKASELRGESIQDVIFKGSGNRKEVSRASVELFFDNAEGRAAGQWSQYAEITVKRVLDREGNSSYYINNLHVRRRDVIDLFLGTGLGPRAYAIIGQGMISRIVEAKPEELRFFLEEAAGVTKYKERRRETEHRLEDARENIARVDDIRNELENQVVHLQAQATVAQQYRGLHEEMSRKQSLLWLKKRNDARNDGQRLTRQIEESVTRVEAETAQLREVEARVEHARENHYAASDALHAAQAEMYAAGSEVSRLESELGHLRDSRSRLETRLTQLEAEHAHWLAQQTTLADDAARWNTLLENSRARVAAAAARHDEAAARLPECEDAVQSAGAEVTEARRALSEAEQALRLAEADRGHAQRAVENLAQRRARLEQDKQALGAPDPALLAASQEAEARSAEALEAGSGPPGRAAVCRTRRRGRSARRTRGLAGSASRPHRNPCPPRCAGAVAIQGGAWRRDRRLAESARSCRRKAAVAADPGRKRLGNGGRGRAARTLLGAGGRCRCTARGAGVAAAGNPYAGHAMRPQVLPLLWRLSLRGKVRCDDPRWSGVLDEWLADVAVAEDIAASVPLAAGRRVSRAGHLLTPAGLTLYVPDARTHGVIERQREIDELAAQLDARAVAEDEARQKQQSVEQELADLQAQLTAARRSAQEAQQALHAAQVEALKLAQAQARFEERSAQIDRDLTELLRQEEAENARIERAEGDGEMQRERLATVRERVERAIDLHRQKDMALRDARAVETQLGT